MSYIIRDVNNSVYVRGRYLGKGSFSKSFIMMKSGHTYCGKFIDEKKDKIDLVEFDILAKLDHPNIIKYVGKLETPITFCLITEYCPNKSMFELVQRRKYLSTYEIRYFLKQILTALQYLHKRNIVHRDIKPQNILLDEKMNVKLADFGMAIQCDDSSCLVIKKHLYGTPNYISPEMITGNIRSYNSKVDIWSVGCVAYFMVFGRNPFRGRNEDELIDNIKACKYSITTEKSSNASNLIRQILKVDPNSRPTAEQLLSHKLFQGFIPRSLPVTALVEKPEFLRTRSSSSDKRSHVANKCVYSKLRYVSRFLSKLMKRSNRKPAFYKIENPSLNPLLWISRVVLEDKHVGYSFNEGSPGMLFADQTVLTLLPNKRTLCYVKNKKKKYYDIKSAHEIADKLRKMKKTVVDVTGVTGGKAPTDDSKEWIPTLPQLRSFCICEPYYVLLLSSGVVEMFHKIDETKLLLSLNTSGFTIVDKNNSATTYDLKLLKDYGFPSELQRSLDKMRTTLKALLTDHHSFCC